MNRASVRFRSVEISDPRFEREGLRHVTVKSAAMRQRADLCVYACPGTEGKREVPLVVLLHGVYGSHWAWAMKGGAHLTAARLSAGGEIPPMVLAMPSDGLWGDGSGYLPHRTRDFERWIVEEVPAAAALAAPCVGAGSPVFLAGLSMGGFGTLRLMAKFPRHFRGASAHSAVTDFRQLGRAVEEKPEEYEAASSDYSVIETMRRNRSELPPFRFDCGTSDWLLPANRELHSALEAEGIGHVYAEYPGGHDWPYWELHLEDTLRFFAGI